SLRMRTSTNRGATWGAAAAPAGARTSLGGQPVVRPNGTVVVPYLSLNDQSRAFTSTNGGASWTSSVLVSSVSHHGAAGGLREEALPSAEVDSAGKVYVVSSDCRFRTGCPIHHGVLRTS